MFKKLLRTQRLKSAFSCQTNNRLLEDITMRKIMLGLAALAAIGIAAPATSALAQDRTVIIKKDGDRGHHYGWRNHRNKKVVIIKERRRHSGAVVVKERSPRVTTGVTIRN